MCDVMCGDGAPSRLTSSPYCRPGSISRRSRARLRGCYARMLGFGQPLPLSFDAALLRDADRQTA
jgi:hypothetical protein